MDIFPFDISQDCGEVYACNFNQFPLRRNIEQLEDVVLENFDLWLMSPPCQPFTMTRDAQQRDSKDKRCAALNHLCDVLPRLKKPPFRIAFENVKGFCNSDAWSMWRNALKVSGYTFEEFLLDPVDFGVPNHRTRYYLLAERSQRFSATTHTLIEEAPELLPQGLIVQGAWARERRAEIEAAHLDVENPLRFTTLRLAFVKNLEVLLNLNADSVTSLLCGPDGFHLLPKPANMENAFLLLLNRGGRAAVEHLFAHLETRASTLGLVLSLVGTDGQIVGQTSKRHQIRCIQEFLQEYPDHIDDLWIPADVLARPYAQGLSYVSEHDRRSFCFTSHYGKVMNKSSGSMLHVSSGGKDLLDKGNLPAAVGHIRLFSPKEILNFLGFPPEFRLPKHLSAKKSYKVAGNSVSVTVISQLLAILFAC